jgi:tartrate dehydrogenase/decarboxylase/D-malate dehydrogenase
MTQSYRIAVVPADGLDVLKGFDAIHFGVIRESTEGEFVQVGGLVQPEHEHGMAMDTSIFTRRGIERIARYAFQLARRRRRRVTNITKSNTLIHSLAYWDRVVEQVSRAYPEVTYSKMYVDNASANFVLHPEYSDVIVTTDFIGDILSDLGGAIMGSLGSGPAATSIRRRHIPPCSSRSMGRPRTSPAGASPIRSGPSGPAR